MADYQLDQLSPRSFEQLVQALALREVTAQLVPFGDGPDGGREATFDGPTSYGPEHKRWDGYGVIQAKHRQRTGRGDGTWALQELRKELRGFDDPGQKRKIPEFYIYATNVILSPTQESGSKDKILKELARFAANYNLKGFDVWDYDKLRILLDNNEAVRNANAAWITSGDVLAELSRMVRSQRQDYYRILTNFLQKEIRSDRFAKLEQAGHSADEAIPLSQVFVDLPVSDRPVLPDAVVDLQVGRYPNFVRLVVEAAEMRNARDHEYLLDGAARKRHDRFVLIGGPGQGKTTLGQLICQTFRTALLVDVPSSRIDTPVRDAMDDIVQQWAADKLPKPNARRFPLRVVLSDFAKQLAEEKSSTMLDYLAQYVGKRASVNLQPIDMREIFVKYPALIVLDGLDEVPASSNRTQVLEAVHEFSVDVVSDNADVLIVATSRPQGYTEEFSTQHYRHLYLVPLPRTIALNYGSKLATIRFGNEPDRTTKVIERLQRASVEKATARLMSSPLQVTIMTLLVDKLGQPPQERWDLFREYYGLIYHRETERDIPTAAVLREHRADIDAIHERVALVLQMETERSGGTDARMTLNQFASIVEAYLREEGHEGKRCEELRQSIIDAAGHRLVFLVGLEAGIVGFEIRSLQEFMAAEGLLDADDAIAQQRLREIAPISNWRNVFLFAAGKCFAKRRYLRDTIAQICAERNEDANDSIARNYLAGSRLALDLLEDGSAAKQPNKCRVLTRLALRLIDSVDQVAHARLVSVFQESTADVYVEELSSRINSDQVRNRSAVFAVAAGVCDVSTVGLPTLRAAVEKRLTQATSEDLSAMIRVTDGRAGLIRDTIIDAVPVLDVAQALPVFRNTAIAIFNSPDVPPWLPGINYLLRNPSKLRRIWVPIRGESGARIGEFGILSVDQPNADSLAMISSIPSGRDSWNLLRATLQFSQEPSKGRLAAALEIASRLEPTQLWSVSNYAPWPLENALRQVLANERVEDLIASAANGGLGDVEEWRLLEQYMNSGVSADWIMDHPEFAISGRLGYTAEPGTFEDAIRLALWFNRFDNNDADFAVHDLFSRAAEEAIPAAGVWVDEIFEALVTSRYAGAATLILHRRPLSDPRSARWLGVLCRANLQIGAAASPVAVKRFSEVLAACWFHEPRPELFAAFGTIAQSPHLDDNFFSDPENSAGEPVRPVDALGRALVRLRRGSSIGDVSATLVEASAYFPAAEAAANTLKARRQDRRALERSLVDLYDLFRGTTSETWMLRHLWQMDDDRTSHLLDENRWYHLGFSESLRRAFLGNFDSSSL
ncbi:NACHT domain-containing protein [Dactylosporangium sp. NPDC048998]|uniref:NACHT domain-containing protein n=1 Tax=Dactylosporangium sp. NPDC048998 TaxID=3363976 RepID=UPI0037103DB1